MYKLRICKIVSRREIAENQIELALEDEYLAHEALPGQFVHINVESEAHMLRRPISICDTEGSVTKIVFEIKGAGTALLAKKNVGDTLDLIGPLGHGFTVEKGKKTVIIGGGLGVFPLLYLAKSLENPKIFLGFRNRGMVCLEDEFSSCGETKIATDDGSYGCRGFAIDLAREAARDADIIYACGPKPMLKAVKQLGEEAGVRTEISMEERMGCGIGACLVCVCQTTEGLQKVCQKGPVFDASEVVM